MSVEGHAWFVQTHMESPSSPPGQPVCAQHVRPALSSHVCTCVPRPGSSPLVPHVQSVASAEKQVMSLDPPVVPSAEPASTKHTGHDVAMHLPRLVTSAIPVVLRALQALGVAVVEHASSFASWDLQSDSVQHPLSSGTHAAAMHAPHASVSA